MVLKILVVCKNLNREKEPKKIISGLDRKGFKVSYVWKNKIKPSNLKNTDMVVAIGGDGTILSAAHYLKDKPILAVNSSPETSVGALATITINELADKLKMISDGNYRVRPLERISVFVNGKEIGISALNDVFIGNEKPYYPSKYELILKGKREKQLSSGILFSTGTGSTAWFSSAGGKPFSPYARTIKMIVREPYRGRLYNPKMIKCIVGEGEYIDVIIRNPSLLAIDSIREFKLNSGDKVRVKISLHPLKRII